MPNRYIATKFKIDVSNRLKNRNVKCNIKSSDKQKYIKSNNNILISIIQEK